VGGRGSGGGGGWRASVQHGRGRAPPPWLSPSCPRCPRADRATAKQLLNPAALFAGGGAAPPAPGAPPGAKAPAPEDLPAWMRQRYGTAFRGGAPAGRVGGMQRDALPAAGPALAQGTPHLRALPRHATAAVAVHSLPF
jgi:hypothetical protein